MFKNLLTKLKNWHYQNILVKELINSHQAIDCGNIRDYLESQVIFWHYMILYKGKDYDRFFTAGRVLRVRGDQAFGLVAGSFPIILGA